MSNFVVSGTVNYDTDGGEWVDWLDVAPVRNTALVRSTIQRTNRVDQGTSKVGLYLIGNK